MILTQMYVRCPIDTEVPDEPRDFAIGKIVKINDISETAEVDFFDNYGIRQYYSVPEKYIFPLSSLLHTIINKNSSVIYNGKRYFIKGVTKSDHHEYYYYYLVTKSENRPIKVCESEIKASFNDGYISPKIQMANYEFQNPSWYFGRNIVSNTNRIIDNSIYGLRELSGCKIHLMPHQIKTVIRCLKEPYCRFMLADEVGLGKTIEAISVLKIYMSDNENKKILILVPDSIIEQWQTELAFKFNIFIGENINNNTVELCPTNKISYVVNQKFDFVIIDEVHRLLNIPTLYNYALKLSSDTQNVLMLSATPIQSRNIEYYNLLKLIQPQKYQNISIETFNKTLLLQQNLIRRIYNIFDNITDYNEEILHSKQKHTEDIQDIFDDTVELFKKIAKDTNDNYIKSAIEKLDFYSDDFGLEKIYALVSYTCEAYQLEKCVIRNRNDNIKQSKRVTKIIPYNIEIDENSTESYVYRLLSEWIETESENNSNFLRDNLMVVEAFFSSAAAFYNEINKLHNIPDELLTAAQSWLIHENQVCNNIQDILSNDPEKYASRIVNIIDYIDQEAYNNKVIMFTGFSKTFELYKNILINYFGKDNCCFFEKNMTPDEIELNVYRFQISDKYKIMLSDESGGEGRNFQIADEIIHIDIPWCANDLEQRIGRLDRIGRSKEKDVVSVIPFAQNSLEEQLYRFWNEGVKLFTQTQSGLEIIMPELDEDIIYTVSQDFKYGLEQEIKNIIIKMDALIAQVKKERYYDVAASKYQKTYKQIEQVLDKYSKNETELFGQSMMKWASLAGFRGDRVSENVIQFSDSSFSPKSAQNTMLVPPDMKKLIDSKINQLQNKVRLLNGDKKIKENSSVIRGTFCRDMAIANDYLHFFAPGDYIYDSIVDNAIKAYKGRCCAFAYQSGISWEGFVYQWYIEPDELILLKNGLSPRILSEYRTFLPSEIYTNTYTISGQDNISEKDIIDILNNLSQMNGFDLKCSIYNFGKRHASKSDNGVSGIDSFRMKYSVPVWISMVQKSYSEAYNNAKQYLTNKFKKQDLISALKEKLGSDAAATTFFGDSYSSNVDRNTVKIILSSFERPKITIDSICYLRLIK